MKNSNPSERNVTNYIWGSVGCVILLVFAGLAIRQSVIHKTSKIPTTSIAPTRTTIFPTLSDAVTSKWITYSDLKLGISIKHPSDIVVIFSQSGLAVQFARKEDASKDFRDITTLDIYDRGAPGTDPVTELKAECSQPCSEKYKKVQINNAVGIQTLGPKYVSPYNFYLTAEDKRARTVRMFIAYNDQSKKFDEFVQMISTLHFIK